MSSTPTPPALVASAIPAPSPRDRARDRAFQAALAACLGASVLMLGTLLYTVLGDGLGRLSLDLLTRFPSALPQLAGLQSALMGTIWLMVVCAAFIVPVGVATSVYLEEYANPERWYNRAIEVNIQNLAAVPSIVYGILGLAFLVRG